MHYVVQAGITSLGTAYSNLKVSDLTRTRHAHQLSILALSKLQHKSFLHSEGPHDDSTKEAWRHAAITKSPTFQFWNMILAIVILGLNFVRNHRVKIFFFYMESLKAWFLFDYHNYTRWISIHIRDKECLRSSVYEWFEECGHWVIQKSHKLFFCNAN